jgi:hypothetical protein
MAVQAHAKRYSFLAFANLAQCTRALGLRVVGGHGMMNLMENTYSSGNVTT